MKPGLYLQKGNETKQIKSLETLNLLGDSQDELSVDKLAYNVSWVFTALDRRKTRIAEIEHEWRKGETVLTESPYAMRLRGMLQRTDEALQVMGVAYWYKLRDGSGKLTGFRWLDPGSMSPDQNSIEVPFGYTRYKRVVSGGVITIPADDLIVFSRMGLGEFAPAPSASFATKLAAEILYFSDESERKVKQDPLPVSLISVPNGTGEQERDRLQNIFWRLFNRSTKASPENRVIPVFEGVEVKRMSMTPEELNFEKGRDPSIEAILSGHGVPMSEVVGNAANFATAQLDTQNFISRLSSRLDDIAEELNLDKEVMAQGYFLAFYPDRHSAMQKDEVETSTALINYAAIMTPEAAAYQVGITEADFPAGMEIFKAEPEVIEDKKPVIIEKAYIEDLRRWRRKATRKKGACEFNSDTIPREIKSKIMLELTAGGDVKKVFEKYIQADIAETQEDTKSLESSLELAIKMITMTSDAPQQSVINITLPEQAAQKEIDPQQLAALVSSMISVEAPAITFTNEVQPTPVTIQNEFNTGDINVIAPEQETPALNVDVNISQVESMHTEYNRDRKGNIESADTEVNNG